MRYNFTPVRIAIIKKSTNSKFWEGCGEKGSLVHSWECKLVQLLWKTAWRYLKKSKNRTTIWSSSCTPGYISKKIKNKNTNSRRYTYSNVHRALYTKAKMWKQPKSPSTDEWVKKMPEVCVVCVYTHNTHPPTHTPIYAHTYIQWNITQP